jgi:hypothetical protein
MNMKVAFSPRIVSVLLVCSVVCIPALAKYGGGTGEPNNPYKIYDANHMNTIGLDSNDWDKNFILMNDIDLSVYTGNQYNIIGYWKTWYSGDNIPFTGVFDGNDNTIYNFSYSTPVQDGIALFGNLGSGSQINDLTLLNVDVNVPGRLCVGALVAWNKGSVTNCRATGNVTASRYTGLLVGYNDRSSSISNCVVSGNVNGTAYPVGGLLGWNEGVVTMCSADANVQGASSTGGLVGESWWTITDCYATGETRGSSQVGGLVGYHGDNTISKCWAAGNVEGTYSVGGLVGENNDRIENCYSIGNVNGSDYWIGGLIGRNYYQVYYCYSSGRVNGASELGGLIGRAIGMSDFEKCFWDNTVNPDVNGISNLQDPNVIGKPTLEMMTESTFSDTGWDFVEVWGIGEGQTYPFLRKHIVGDLNHDGIVDWRDFAIFALHWLEGGGI